MHGHYTKRNADELLHEYLLRREKMLRNRRYRDNIILFIDLLSRYLPRKSLQMVKTSGGLYESISKKYGEKPCGGYTVQIAIEKLPGNFNKTLKNKNK